MRVLLILCLASFVISEERGRLPDGRAFRTDADGNQVIDYIAELETTVDALTEQVIALEDKGATSCPQQSCPTLTCPEPVSCDAEVQAAVRNVLERSTSEASRAESSITEARKEVELLRAELERERAKARSEITSLRASMRAPEELSIRTPAISNAEEMGVSPALVSLRGTVLTEINRLKGRLSKRDTLFKGGSIMAGAVKIKSTNTVASNGKSLDALRSDAGNAKSLRELAEIRRGLYQIREIIEKDIKDAERLSR